MKASYLILASAILASGCSQVDTDQTNTTSNEMVPEEASVTSVFSTDNLYDGVALVGDQFENSFQVDALGSPTRGAAAEIPADVVAPQRCLELANLIYSAAPESLESGYGYTQFFWEGNWGSISGMRTSPEYRQSLSSSIEDCAQLSWYEDAKTIYNGEIFSEDTNLEIDRVVSSNPDEIVLELSGQLSRQMVDIYETGDCLQNFGTGCMAYFGAKYRLYLVSEGEYSLFFMVESWSIDESIPSLGVSASQMDAINEKARDFLRQVT